MWNKLDDYYFNTSSGIQFSNHYQEYWSKNVMGIGYYSGEEWKVIYWTDTLKGFDGSLSTNNQTYVNATIWKDLTYGSYNFRLAIRYHLKADDSYLTIQPYIKNLGIPIPFKIGFAWRLKDIKISNTEIDDTFQFWYNEKIDGNWTQFTNTYLLNGTINKTYKYYNTTGFKIDDIPHIEHLILKWDWKLQNRTILKVKSIVGQYNAPITLFIKVGTLASNQEKTANFLWHDATQINDCDSLTDWSIIIDGYTHEIDESDKQEGTGSLQHNVGTGTGWWHGEQFDPSGTWDWSSYDKFKLWIKVEDNSHAVRLQLYTDWSNYAYWEWTPRSANIWIEEEITLSSPDSETGTLDLTSIDWLRVVYMIPSEWFKIDDLRVESAGETYERDVDLGLTWAGEVSRTWNLTRVFNLGLDWSGDSQRKWDATRIVNLLVDWSGSTTRTWSLKRVFDLVLSWSGDASRKLTTGEIIKRVVNFGITWAGSATRYLGQFFYRTVTWGLSWEADAYREITEGYLWKLLTIYVVTDESDPVQDALASCWEEGGSMDFSELTNSTGYTSQYNVTSGNHTLMVSKENYQTYTIKFDLTHNRILEVTLPSIEAAIMIDIPLIFIGGLAIIFTYMGWKPRNNDEGLTGSALGMLFWGVTWGYWIMQYHASNTGLLAWAFVAPFFICIGMVWEYVTNEPDKKVRRYEW